MGQRTEQLSNHNNCFIEVKLVIVNSNLRDRFSVSSSSFLVFKLVLLEAALFEPAVAALEDGYREH